MVGLSAQEMQYEAKIVYEAIASADAPGYTPRQWSILLTQAQENIVMETLRLGFDFDELRRRVIQSLLNTQVFTEVDFEDNPPAEAFGESAYTIPIEEDYLHIVKDTANFKVKVKPVSYDFYHANINNPFESPSPKEFWRLVGKHSLVIVTDGDPLISYEVIYIKRPLPIITAELSENQAIEGITDITNCGLDHSVHRQVVTEAAKLAHAYTSNQSGYQIQLLENNRSRFGPQG